MQETTEIAGLEEVEALPPGAYVDAEGFVISPDGEVIGFREPESPADPDRPFAVADRESAEWVLSRIADAEARVAGIEARKAAMVENFERQSKKFADRAKWLNLRFGPELEMWARRELDNQVGSRKAKSLTLDNATVGFRTNPGGIKLTDPDAAIAWLEIHGHRDAIREVRTTTATAAAAKVDLELARAIDRYEESEDPVDMKIVEAIRRRADTFLSRTPARENFYIKTGIRKD